MTATASTEVSEIASKTSNLTNHEISKSSRSSGDGSGHSDCYDYSKNRKSRWITDLIVYRPYVMILLSFGVAAIFSIIYFSGALNTGNAEAGGQILAIRELEVQWYQAHQAHDNRQLDDDTVAVRSTGDDEFDMLLIYEATNGVNMFTPEGVRAIYRNERAMVGDGTRCPSCAETIDDYTQFCVLDYPRAMAEGRTLDPCNTPVELRDCADPTSPLTMFFTPEEGFASYWDITQEDVNAITQADIDEKLSGVTLSLKNLPVPGIFLDANFRAVDEENPNMRSIFTRSQFQYGIPFCGENADGSRKFRNRYDKSDEQTDVHRPFILQYPDFFAEDDPQGTEVFYLQGVLADEEIQQIINGDFFLAGAAGAFIFLGIWLQTRSLIIAFAGILNIGMSYPVALFFYHGVFQIEIDTSLNRLVIFIVLGIGADDIFIVMDAWKQSYHQNKNVSGSVATQMNWTWLRAAKAMGITSFTTLFAFIMTAVSPIPMIETFGIFAAMMVLFNYLLIITFFPACVRLWNIKYERQCWGKPIDPETGENQHVEVDDLADIQLVDQKQTSNNSHEHDDEAKSAVSIKVDVADDDNNGDAPKTGDGESETATKNGTHEPPKKEDSLAADGPDKPGNPTDTLAVPEKSANEKSVSKSKSKKFDPEHDVDISKYRKLEQYFYSIHAPIIYRFRKALVGLFFIVLVLGSVGTGYISLPSEPDTFLPERSELNKGIEASGEFPASASTADLSPLVFVYYGINSTFPLDREGLDPNDVGSYGEIQPDRAFTELLTIDNQHGIVDICDQIIAVEDDEGSLLVPRADHTCIMRDYKAWEATRYADETDDLRILSDRMLAYSLLLRSFAFGLDSVDLADHIGFEFLTSDEPDSFGTISSPADDVNIFTEREEVVALRGTTCIAAEGCVIPNLGLAGRVTNGVPDEVFTWNVANASASNAEFVINLQEDTDVNAIELRAGCDDTYTFSYINMAQARMPLVVFESVSSETCTTELADFTRVDFDRGIRAHNIFFSCAPGADGECQVGDIRVLRSPSPASLTHIRLQFAQTAGVVAALPERRLQFNGWRDAMDDINANAPEGLNNAFQTSRVWAFIVTNDVLVDSTVVSIVISFCIAVICLLIATSNLIIAGLASFTILGIVVSTIGVFTAAGATLDLMRSMIYVLLVGLSVDYVVHLANAVNDSPLQGRFERARHGLLDVGISVFGAAVTTMGSAVFLFFGSLDFFTSFGTNLFVTILMSLLWSTVGFMGFLMYLGPDKKPQGDITHVFGFLRSTFKSKSESDNDSNDESEDNESDDRDSPSGGDGSDIELEGGETVAKRPRVSASVAPAAEQN